MRKLLALPLRRSEPRPLGGSSPALNLLKGPKGLLFLIIIIAAFLRLTDLPNIPPGLYPDEAMNGNNALEALATHDWKVFYPENNGREGLFINIQSFSLALFGNEPWALRLPSTIFGILTVLGIYFLTKELFGYEIRKEYENTKNEKGKDSYIRNKFVFRSEHIALLAAFLLATSFWHINFSRIGFRAIMAPTFLVWGIYLLLLSLRKIIFPSTVKLGKSQITNHKLQTNSKFQTKTKNLWDLVIGAWCLPVLAGLVYGLGFHSYIAYRATPLLILFIIAAYWFKNKDPEVRKRIILTSFFFILSSIIVFLPLGLYFLQHPDSFFGRTTQISVFSAEGGSASGGTSLSLITQRLALNTAKTLGMLNFAGDYNWRHNLAGQPQLFWPVGILFLVGVFIALKPLIRRLKIKSKNDASNLRTFHFSFFFLISWIIIAALPVVISNEGLPHALRAILMIPPVFILSGVGGMAIYNFLAQRIKNASALKTASFILLLYLLLTTYYTYFLRWAKNPNTADAFSANYVKIGRQLNALPADQPKFVIVNAGGVDVRGIPMSAQTVMFITDTFTPTKRAQKNIHYLLPKQAAKESIPKSAFVINLN